MSLARALVRDADLYLLDEPMGQLEPQLRAVLRGRIKSLLAEREMTAIFVTHDQTEASALADRIAVMEDGVLQQFASEKELKNRPANLFVASFVGEPPMNLLETEVTRTDGGFRLSAGTGCGFPDPGQHTRQGCTERARGGAVRADRHPAAEDCGWIWGCAAARRVQSMARRSIAHRGSAPATLLIAVTPNRIAARPGDVIQFALEPRHHAHFRRQRYLHSSCGVVLTMPPRAT